MFHQARIKLTFWYLLIIMVICTFFSTLIYVGITNDLKRVSRIVEFRRLNPHLFQALPELPPRREMPFGDPEQVERALQLRLLAINGIIFIFSGIAGYFLAGKTLKPIKEMVDEQNRFITDASHELRTPLTALRTELEVASTDTSLSLQESKRVIESSLEEVKDMQQLSEHLLNLTQINQNKPEPKFTKHSLLDVSEHALKKIIPLAKNKHITIENKFEDISFYGDKSMTELLIILLDNAIKYSPKNSVIKMESDVKDTTLQLSISDNGIGISPDDIEHIFDRFYRVDKSRSKMDTQGYGLGLSIAKKL